VQIKVSYQRAELIIATYNIYIPFVTSQHFCRSMRVQTESYYWPVVAQKIDAVGIFKELE